MSKEKILVVSTKYKEINRFRKKNNKLYHIYVEGDLNKSKVMIPSLSQIIIINSKPDEHRWRRILYRKGITLKITNVLTI